MRSTLFRLLPAALILLCGVLGAEPIKSLPAPVNYVSDNAGVLSPTVIDQINHLCSLVDHRANAQIAVVTIHSLDGMEVSDYANRLEEAWKVGPKGSNRGVLMLFAIRDRKRWIEVGYGLEGILPDGKVGEIGRTMVPSLRTGNYDGAVQLGVGQVAQIIAADAHVTLDEQAPQPRPVERRHSSLPLWLLLLLLCPGVVILFFVLRLLMAAGFFLGGGGPWMGGGGYGGGGFGGGGFGDGGGGDGGFGGFGGGESGGGGAGGSW